MKNLVKKHKLASKKEIIISGLGASQGIAIGKVLIRSLEKITIPFYQIEKNDIKQERKRFFHAVSNSQKQLRRLKEKAAVLPEAASEELGYLLDAHLAMLTGSRLIRGVEKMITQDLLNTEAAISKAIEAIKKDFSTVEDSYLASRVAEIEEAGNRLLRNLTTGISHDLGSYDKNTILIAEDLSPAEIALIDPKKIIGIGTVLGGIEGHTAIMARSFGMPAVLGASELLSSVEDGDLVVLDGMEGKIFVNPSKKTIRKYQAIQSAINEKKQQLVQLTNLPAITKDHEVIELSANIELSREAESAYEGGAEGIGLLRTEFLYMNRKNLPSTDELFEAYREVVLGMKGRPVTIRILDVGGEKLPENIRHKFTESLNPALGLRAIRFDLKYKDILKSQLAAILRAGFYGPVKILLPLVTKIEEIIEFRKLLDIVIEELKEKNTLHIREKPPVGVMIEVPGAALVADNLALHADFFSIGTNDLTMYTLAIDRSDEQVAYLYNSMHPSILRLIQFSCEAGKRAKIPVNICGEIGGDARYVAILMGLGLRSFSMSPHHLCYVKQRIRDLTLKECQELVQLIMKEHDEKTINAIIEEFNKDLKIDYDLLDF